MVTCLITIKEGVNGLMVSIEPDNRDGNKLELGLSFILDKVLKEFMSSVQEKLEKEHKNFKSYNFEDGATDLAREIMRKHFK